MVMQRVRPTVVHASQEPIRSTVVNRDATPASISKIGRVSLAHFACFVVVYNITVIVWGAYVRATGSGAGCDYGVLREAPTRLYPNKTNRDGRMIRSVVIKKV